MKVVMQVIVVWENERALVLTDGKGMSQNLVDVSAMDVEELNQVLGMALRSVRRQLLQLAIAELTSSAAPDLSPAES